MIAQTPVSRHGGSARCEPSLNGSRDDAALSVQKEKRDHANQRRQRRRQRRHRLEQSPPAKLDSAQQEREWKSHCGRRDH